MPYLSRGDVEVYYEVHGPKRATAPVLVFAHGAGGNHLSWWQQVPHFRRTHTCVVFDHRGFGLTRVADPASGGAHFASDLAALLDHLEVERASLVAQSMGGWTCLRFALEQPKRVERLVMADTHGGARSDEIDAMWSLQRPPDMSGLPEGAHPACGARMFGEQPVLHFLYTEIAALNQITLVDTAASLRAAGTPTAAELASVAVPVLFIAGEEDIVIPPAVLDATAKHIPGARVERVPDAGHSVYFERAERFNALVETFLGS
jgi:3-oxoadipate enol-lactonase